MEAWRAVIHGVAKSWTWLSDWSDLIWSEHIKMTPLILSIQKWKAPREEGTCTGPQTAQWELPCSHGGLGGRRLWWSHALGRECHKLNGKVTKELMVSFQSKSESLRSRRANGSSPSSSSNVGEDGCLSLKRGRENEFFVSEPSG